MARFTLIAKKNLTLENVGDLNRLRTKDILIESL